VGLAINAVYPIFYNMLWMYYTECDLKGYEETGVLSDNDKLNPTKPLL